MPFTKHSIQHPLQADVFEQVGYTGCGFSIQFPIAENPACSVEDLLSVSIDYLTNKKTLSKKEEQALQFIEDARIVLSSEEVSTTEAETVVKEKTKRSSRKKTTNPVETPVVVPVVAPVEAPVVTE